MSSPNPADPAPSPEPGTPAPEPRSPASAPGPAIPGPSVAPVSTGQDPLARSPEELVFAPQPPRRDPREAPGREGQNRLALYATVLLAVVLAFGSGIAVGRATAPGAGEAIVASMAPSTPAASEAPPSGSPAASGASDASASPASPSAVASGPLAGLPADGSLLGSKTAKVQLTYWADFQCPFCATFGLEVLPQLASRIADGTVSVLHRDFAFLGPESLDAAIAVRCAGEQGQFWPMHDAVYAAQAGENRGTFSAAKLKELAVGVGVDAAKFTACAGRHDVLVSVLSDTAAGTNAGVKSTPTIDIPGRTFLGVTDAAALLAAVDAAAASGATPTPAPSVQPSSDPWIGVPTSGRTAGASSAPVTVELWVDYQATGMPAIVGSLEPGLQQRVTSGKAQLVLRDLATLGDESVLAGSFIRCGAQSDQRFVWFAHDILGSSAQGANAGVFTSRSLLWLAAKLGWDVAALDTCMADPATASALQAETAVGTGLGLTAAPAVIVKKGDKEVARFSGSSLDATKVLAAVDAAAK